ncbi:hypothetical protein D3C75_1028470 [compost metagenome]
MAAAISSTSPLSAPDSAAILAKKPKSTGAFLEWISMAPCATFENLPAMPANVILWIPKALACSSEKPTYSPIWIKASSGSSANIAIAYFSLLPPVVKIICLLPIAAATEIACTTLAL